MTDETTQTMHARMWAMKFFFILVLLGVGVWGYKAFFTRRVVTVVGVGKEQVAANKATIVFAYTTSSISQESATDKGEQGLSTILNSLNPLSPVDVKKIQYQIQPRYNTTTGSNEYLYVSGASVTVSGPGQISEAIKMLSVPNVQISGVSYLPENQVEADKMAQDAALKDAKLRAENIAKATGGRVGKVLSVAEQGSNAQTGSTVTSVDSKSATPLQTVEIQSVMTVSYELQ